MRLSLPGAWSLCLLLLILPGLNLFAQEEMPSDDDPDLPIESEWVDFDTPYVRGDKTFNISLGLLFPLYFSGIEDNDHGLSIGGTGSLGLNYFLGPRFFLGAELSGMFASTRRGNMIYIIPFGVRAGYQFISGRFEFPISLMVGAAPQKYLEDGYFGLFVKPGVSAYWRFNPDWSFGLNTNWWIVPQWPKNGQDVLGHFFELTLSARHHF